MTRDRDFLAALGARAFATRLRRLFEALNRGVSAFYAEAGVDFEPRWFGLMRLLKARTRLEIGTAAAVLGQSHVAVVQVANILEARGLIRRTASRTDGRRRTLEITAKGRVLCRRLAPLWESVGRATEALLKEAAPDFLKELDELDRALERRPFGERIKNSHQRRSRP